MRTMMMRSAATAISQMRFASALGSKRILILGGLGQVGAELSKGLRAKYGKDNVIVSDIQKPAQEVYDQGPYQYIDVMNKTMIEKVVVDNKIDWVLHLSAIMSVLGEMKPTLAMDLNITGVRNVFDVCRDHKCMVFCPSSMAVYGPQSGKHMVKEDVLTAPTTIYGITKILMEQLGAYYFKKWGMDFRCIRLPGIISASQLPGGGTTDYAVHMYFHALRKQKFTCDLNRDEMLPMMYVTDCTKGTLEFLEAPRENLTRCTYNITGFSFSPELLHKSIQKVMPLEMEYKRGWAQDIAASWPDTMDDTAAQKDWAWKPDVDLDKMTKIMFEDIPKFHKI